ncbi:MAG TPA: ABC transporter ATP-binding protein [Candidatus Saccharimonadales bacterium]|jgi:ATP-binding cassette subfamily B protein/ATP-binding cassette subfamily C protein
MSEPKKLTTKEQAKAIGGVARLSFKIAPGPVLFKLAGAFIDAVLPILTTYFAARTTTALVDAYAGNSDAGRQAIIFIVITALLGLLMTVWRSLDSYIQSKMRYVVEAAVSDRMYAHFLALEFWRYDDKDTADLYDRALKFSQFFSWIFDRLASLISQLIGVAAATIALALLEPWLALAVILAIAPGIYLQFRLSRKQIAHWNENVEVRRAQNLLEWHLNQPRYISELRLYGMVDFMLRHRRKLRDTDEKGRIEFEKTFMPIRIATDALEAIVELGALIWISLQIIGRNQPVGQFIYVQQVVSRAMQNASSFISTLGQIDEDIANLFDYEQFMQLPTRKVGGKVLTTPPQQIIFEHVTFSYPGSKAPAIDNLSFTISAHQHVAIVGENGAGKSTLIKLLTGLYIPTKGRILLDGISLDEYDIASWHKQLGVLQQEFIHYNFATARDNVRFGAVDSPHTTERIREALKLAEADEFVTKLPQGENTYVNNWMEDDKGNKGVDLSGGQWQRLALARDFYRAAPIVILDEPTSAIDALAETRIFKHLFADKQRMVITISHRLSTVQKADAIFMLEDGKLVESGTHAELITQQDRYVRMFKSQLKD